MSAERLFGTLVIGGGLAGAAAAIRLRDAGQPVTLLERERHPHHKVCGEFLSAEGVRHLRALGIEAAALGAVAIRAVRLVGRRGVVARPLGFEARSITRHRLDAALLDAAAARGADVRRGVSAREILPGGDVRTSHGLLSAPAVLVATGKHRLRGHARPASGTIDHLVGFKAYFRLAPGQRTELAGHTELLLFEGGYAGLQPVERDMANLCFVVDPARFAALGGRFDALLSDLSAELPHLARRLEAAVPLLDRPLAISGLPYGYLLDPDAACGTAWPLGDQAAVIPSFTGLGMSLALHGAMLAVGALLAGEGVGAYARRLRRDAGGAVARATRLQRLVGERGRGPERLLRIARAAPPLLSAAIRLTRLPGRAVRHAAPAG